LIETLYNTLKQYYTGFFMTMHLLGPAYSTISTRKKRPKMTKANQQRWAQEMTQYNKQARQRGQQQLTLDQYIDYVHGKGLPKPEKSFKEIGSSMPSGYRSTAHIPSADMTKAAGCAPAPEAKKYSGERRLLGIATMHKSNMVPVFDDEEGNQYAKDLARMRR
jgi:hypothetical protein